jgi:uncharacterized protein YkwD
MPHFLRPIAMVLLLSGCLESPAVTTTEEAENQHLGVGTCKDLEAEAGDKDRTSLDEEEARFLERINAHRKENGLEPLSACRSLNRASQAHSEDMRDRKYFAHKDLGGTFPPDRACEACYNGGCFGNASVGENIAAGYLGGEDTFGQWKSSPGHNANMLNAEYEMIGIGRALGGEYGAHWTTVFGSDDEASCDEPLGE